MIFWKKNVLVCMSTLCIIKKLSNCPHQRIIYARRKYLSYLATLQFMSHNDTHTYMEKLKRYYFDKLPVGLYVKEWMFLYNWHNWGDTSLNSMWWYENKSLCGLPIPHGVLLVIFVSMVLVWSHNSIDLGPRSKIPFRWASLWTLTSALRGVSPQVKT